jgi:hypothetical protein
MILSLLALSMFAASCSEESATDFNATETSSKSSLTARGAVWDGEIGVDVGGVYKITADQEALKADLDAIWKREGKNTSVQTLEIVKLTASDNPADSGFMLVGTDAARTSIGVWLVRSNNSFLNDDSFQVSTSCEGCAQGCNLTYLTLNGKKVAFCNENGCTYDCTKTESSR